MSDLVETDGPQVVVLKAKRPISMVRGGSSSLAQRIKGRKGTQARRVRRILASRFTDRATSRLPVRAQRMVFREFRHRLPSRAGVYKAVRFRGVRMSSKQRRIVAGATHGSSASVWRERGLAQIMQGGRRGRRVGVRGHQAKTTAGAKQRAIASRLRIKKMEPVYSDLGQELLAIEKRANMVQNRRNLARLKVKVAQMRARAIASGVKLPTKIKVVRKARATTRTLPSRFVRGGATRGKAGALSIKGDTLYSYARPIAHRKTGKGGKTFVHYAGEGRSSVTTNRHITAARVAGMQGGPKRAPSGKRMHASSQSAIRRRMAAAGAYGGGGAGARVHAKINAKRVRKASKVYLGHKMSSRSRRMVAQGQLRTYNPDGGQHPTKRHGWGKPAPRAAKTQTLEGGLKSWGAQRAAGIGASPLDARVLHGKINGTHPRKRKVKKMNRADVSLALIEKALGR